jgi:hypothetical protein
METEMLTSNCSNLAEVPALSRQAGDSLLMDLPGYTAMPENEMLLKCWQGLRMANLPGWEKVVSFQDDAWVFRYEQTQEALAKRQRQAGQQQNGVFYTPPAVAKYLVERTLGQFLQQTGEKIREAFRQGNRSFAQSEWQKVQAVRVIDPACGTGVFLVEALQCLHAFYREIMVLEPDWLVANPAHVILSNQLAGIDLDPMSVMITELRLAQWAACLDEHPLLLTPSDFSLWVGDTLQDEFASNNSQVEAGEIFQSDKWHFILGNPPYITEVRNQAKRFRLLKQETSKYYQAKMDLCDGFLAWAMDHLTPGGQLAYVLPAYWTQRSSTAPLRTKLWADGIFREIWNFEAGSLFKNAPGHHTALVIWEKHPASADVLSRGKANDYSQENEPELFKRIELAPDVSLSGLALKNLQFGQGRSEIDLQVSNLKQQAALLEERTGKFLLGDETELGLLAKLAALPPLLCSDEIQQGLVIPQGRLKSADRARLPQGLQAGLAEDPGVFVLNQVECAALELSDAEQELLRPFYRPAGFHAFRGFPQSEAEEWIIYTDLKNRRALEQNPEQYGRLRAHLDRFAAVNTSAFAPYGLHRARQAEWFEDTRKILAPRQVFVPSFSCVDFPAYVNEGFLIIRPKPQVNKSVNQDEHWWCALLNSKLAWFWFYHQKRKGIRLQIDKEVLCQFPKPRQCSCECQAELGELTQMLALPGKHEPKRMPAMQDGLNELVYQAYGLTLAEVSVVERLMDELAERIPAGTSNGRR